MFNQSAPVGVIMAQAEDGYQLSGMIGYPEVKISISISDADPQQAPALTG
jgi:hypothetical protein